MGPVLPRDVPRRQTRGRVVILALPALIGALCAVLVIILLFEDPYT